MAKILIIEDEATIRANLARFLRFERHQVIIAEDGQIGLQAIRSERPELILCDIMMPRMDGITVFETLQTETEALQKIPFVFLTARADRMEVEALLTAPPDDYLIKPFNLQDLLAVIDRNLRQSGKNNGLPNS